jgi:hypothetical protein
MDKIGRNYSLDIETEDGSTLTVEPPFTLEFDITRNTLTSANVCSFRILNLSLKHRNKIRFNSYDSNNFRSIAFFAGYGDNMPMCFNGNITQAWSVREGVNFVSQIESFDGGYAFVNAKADGLSPFPAGTLKKTVITALASSLPNVSIGAIGNFPGTIDRGFSGSGNTVKLLAELTGGGFFIDNGKVFCLNRSETVDGSISVINSQTGLLGTPVREKTFLSFDMLFEPRLQAGQQIILDSTTAPGNYNGVYKVVSVKHRGVISDAVCGEAITTVGLFYGENFSTVATT